MDKLVFVKELSSGTTKGGKSYPVVTDQDNEKWNIWLDGANLELQKSYLFTFVLNDKGFKDIQKITPVINIFHQKALKEVASRNDIVRNLTVCLSYAKDMFIAGVIGKEMIFDEAMEMYQWINKEADSLMPKTDENVRASEVERGIHA